VKRSFSALPVFFGILLLASTALAGGSEFPGDGAHGLGRGATGFTRADDGTVLLRNPALLADLWDDQALVGASLQLVDACFQPTGAYGWGTQEGVADFGEGPLYTNAGQGDTDVQGQALTRYTDEPYPRVCYQGPMPFLPQVALTMKLSDDLGVGLGFLPPDASALNQWGNRDGTVNTENGLRPNPLRYYRSHQNVSFFTLTGGVGYRISPLIRVGLALQWNLAVFESRTWTTPFTGLNPGDDVRTDVFGRDLFIPGVIASVQLRPIDRLDVALGFKWSEAIESKAKLDITSSAFGTGEVFEYIDGGSGELALASATVPTTAHNQTGIVRAPPIWAPQLSLGLRYSEPLKPRVRDWKLAREVAKGAVEDSMATERWDVEFNAIYFFTSVYDEVLFSSANAELDVKSISTAGEVQTIPDRYAGDCTRLDDNNNCIGRRETSTRLGGNDQIGLRLGGDYNLLPGMLALRAGLSYETRGQKPETLNVLQYMLSRTGIHAGLTLRIAGKTDLSIGFAHFIHENIRLQVNPASNLPPKYRSEEYHFASGQGIEAVGPGAGEVPVGDFDGIAGIEVPNAGQDTPGPYFINAGSFRYDLQVLSLSLSQHF